MKHVLQFLFIATVLIYGCTTKKNNEENGVKIIKVPNNKWHQEDFVDNVLDTIIFIPLETSDSSLIGAIDKISFINNQFFIFDKQLGKCITIFNSKGNFLKKLDLTGDAPNVLKMLTDVYIDSSGIYSFNGFENIINHYNLDGNFVKSISTPKTIFVDNFVKIDSSFIFYTGYNTPPDAPSYRIHIYDILKNVFTATYLPYPKELDELNMMIHPRIAFTPYLNQYRFAEPDNDTIYAIDKSAMHPEYLIEFLENPMPGNFFVSDPKQNSPDKADKLGYSRYYSSFWESNDFLKFDYVVEKKSIKTFLYNKNKNEIIANSTFISSKKYGITIMPNSDLYTSGNLSSSLNNEFIAYYHSEYFLEIKNIPENKIKQYQELNFINNIKEGDNPIVSIVRFKKQQ